MQHTLMSASRPDLLSIAIDSLRGTPLWPTAHIWDNSPDGWVTASRADWPLPIVRPIVPLSWAQSMNAFQRQARDAGLTVWSYQHGDARVPPGSAEQFVAKVREAADSRWATVFTYYDLVSAYHTAAVTDVGPWDAYFPDPNYHCDQDWFRRAKLKGYALLESHAPVIHLEGGSTTIHADPTRKRIHDLKTAMNQAYYRAKWGGDHGAEQYAEPWNVHVPA